MVGLGNPGRRYAATRHNAGLRVAERFAERQRIVLDEERYGGRFGWGPVGSRRVAVLAPETWMNLSGQAVGEAVRALPVENPAADLIVVLDDADLPFGRLRLRARGGDGGQRGLRDVLRVLDSRDVPRLRFGIGRPENVMETTDWVLQPFSPEEERALPGHLDRAAEAVELFLAEGAGPAMNRFNADPDPSGG